MANQYFSVKEQLFDIHFTNRSLVHELQNRVSRVYNDRLIRAMNDCLERIIPEDALVRLDSLTLNIGEVSYDSLENELEDKIIEALEQQLVHQLNLLREKTHFEIGEDEIIEQVAGNADLLEHFLLNGTLPWWVQDDIKFNLDTAVTELFEKDGMSLRGLIIRLGKNAYVRERLVSQFTEESLRKIITVLEPAEAAYILVYQKEVVIIQQKEQVVQAETTAFAKAVWLFILTYLLDDRSGEFNRREFVRANLVQMAAYFNIDYHALINAFYQAVSNDIVLNQQANSLERIIKELALEDDNRYYQSQGRKYLPTGNSITKNAEQLSAKTDIILYYFRYGTLPPGINGYSKTALVRLYMELVKDIPVTLKKLLLELKGNIFFAARYYELLGEEKGKELMFRLYPTASKLLATFSSLIELIQNRQPVLFADIAEVKLFLAERSLTGIVFADNEDELSLLQILIARFAEAYGQDAKQLATTIHNAIQKEFRQGILNSNLPALIEQIVLKSDEIFNEQTEPQESIEDEQVNNSLQDTLIYLVQYGHIPWWGKGFFHDRTADQLFRQLLLSSLHAMMQLVRFAGTEQKLQQRLLSFVSINTLHDMFSQFSTGVPAIAVIKQTTGWIESGMQKYGVIKSTASKIIINAFWDELINYQYESFSLTGFYSLVVLRVADHLQTQPLIVAGALYEMMKDNTGEEAETTEEKEILDNIINLLHEEQVAASKNLHEIPFFLREDLFIKRLFEVMPEQDIADFINNIAYDENDPGSSVAPELIRQSSSEIKQLAAKESANIIRYYFTWNRLPDDICLTDHAEMSAFVKQMIILLYSIEKTMLSAVLQEIRMHVNADVLTELFDANKGGDEKQLAGLMEEIALRETVNDEIEIISIPSSIDPEEDIDKGILDLVKTISPAVQSTKGDLFYDEAVNILNYFLKWNRLPDEWKGTEQLSAATVVKQLLLILYKERRQALQNLLQDQTHSVAARLFFHELVSFTKGGIEKEAALFIQPYKESYRQKMLLQSVPAISLSPVQTKPDELPNEILLPATEQLISLIDEFLSATQSTVSNEKIMEAVVQLYSIDQPALKKILEKEDHPAASRVRLHDIFITQTGYQEREVARLLQQYWQKDIFRLLADKNISINSNDPAELAKILLGILTEGEKGSKKSELWKLAISSPFFIRYVTIDGGQDVLETIVQKNNIGWGKDVIDTMQSLHRFFEAAVPNRLERDKLITLLMQFNLLFLSGNITLKSRDAYLKAVFNYINRATHNIPISVFDSLLEYVLENKVSAAGMFAGSQNMLENELRILSKQAGDHLLRKKEWQEEQDRINEEQARKKTLQLEEIRKELEKEKLRQEELRKKELEQLEEGNKNNKIYIRNAGLVLLHPFIGTYFSMLGLLENGQFIDKPAQQRAVLLLQHLVNGRNESEEFELALNKILCGLPVAETIPLTIELTEQEITVSEELFEVVFKRWEKGRASLAGFRASFIHRDGALSKENENWSLRVEQRPYDLLLQTCPWGFSMIKTKWMTQILTVEWI